MVQTWTLPGCSCRENNLLIFFLFISSHQISARHTTLPRAMSPKRSPSRSSRRRRRPSSHFHQEQQVSEQQHSPPPPKMPLSLWSSGETQPQSTSVRQPRPRMWTHPVQHTSISGFVLHDDSRRSIWTKDEELFF